MEFLLTNVPKLPWKTGADSSVFLRPKHLDTSSWEWYTHDVALMYDLELALVYTTEGELFLLCFKTTNLQGGSYNDWYREMVQCREGLWFHHSR